MNSQNDLIYEVFSSLDKWGGEPGEGFSDFLASRYPNVSTDELIKLETTLRNLQKIVRNAYCHKPNNQPVIDYLRQSLPELTEQTYQLAEGRIMYMSIM